MHKWSQGINQCITNAYMQAGSAWQSVYVFSTFFSLNKILRLQPVILFFFSLRIRFSRSLFLCSDQNIRKEPTFFQYIFHSLLFWRFMCAPFSSMLSFYLHSSALFLFSFGAGFYERSIFSPNIQFLSALCVYVYFWVRKLCASFLFYFYPMAFALYVWLDDALNAFVGEKVIKGAQ